MRPREGRETKGKQGNGAPRTRFETKRIRWSPADPEPPILPDPPKTTLTHGTSVGGEDGVEVPPRRDRGAEIACKRI